MSMRFIVPILFLFLVGQLNSWADGGPLDEIYRRQGSWQDTVAATREAFQLSGITVFPIGSWSYSMKAYQSKSLSEKFPPETVTDENKEKRLWRGDGNIRDGQDYQLRRNKSEVVYFRRDYECFQDTQEINAIIGTNGSIAVRLNGKEVYHLEIKGNKASRKSMRQPVTLKLKKGRNTVLVKTLSNTGKRSFYFSPGSVTVTEALDRIAQDYPEELRLLRHPRFRSGLDRWFCDADSASGLQRIVDAAHGELGPHSGLDSQHAALDTTEITSALLFCVDAARKIREFELVAHEWTRVTDTAALRRAIKDLSESHPNTYQGKRYLAQLDEFEEQLSSLKTKLDKREGGSLDRYQAYKAFRREVLLSNPILDFDKLLLVRREANNPGLPSNWQGNESLSRTGYNNDIAMLSRNDLDRQLQTVFRPTSDVFVGDLDLHFNGRRLLISMPGANGRWQVHEIELDSAMLDAGIRPVARELSLIPDSDVDNYDACYLPNDNILFTSTATYAGVPCVRGKSHVANIYSLETPSGRIRRLTFDQDHNWNPTLLNNGRVMYLRWEYSDLPHFVSRILFHMNPDGTNQSEYYGSGSYWPNSFFYARAVPDHPTRVVGIASGHHGSKRAGELVILDPALGRHEADGAVQRIPGYGKSVEPVIADRLVDPSWPKFLHPYPLSSKYFLVSASLSPGGPWGIYLVDVFDNILLLREEDGLDLFEPVPWMPRHVPPVMPSRVNPDDASATVYIEDIYEGDGLKGVPRGEVKKLRLVTYHFSYRGMGGQQDPLGLDGPWDIKCVLGTVPVEPDGSARFRVPANLPISYQPLDNEGKAIQLMRSWSTAMPGENVSCVGCHERQNTGPTNKRTIAAVRDPSEITPWQHGPLRGFSFERDVEPVVDQYCAECHRRESGQTAREPEAPQIQDSYMFLRRLVRTPTMEGDMHMCEPYEFHADTTELVRMLRTGHYNARLDPDAWDRIITWIDLNTPRYGSWTENVGRERMANCADRRRDLMKRYAGIDGVTETAEDFIAEDWAAQDEPPAKGGVLAESPFLAVKLISLSSKEQNDAARSIDLGDGNPLDLVPIPSGKFTAGTETITIEQPFWMARTEVTNRQFAQFTPRHDSRLEPGDYLHFDPVKRGSPLNAPDQPVVKISWEEANGYCEWLSEKTGLDVGLPTEHEWEWACRAGAETSFWYGDGDSEFERYANLADAQFRATTRSKRIEWRPAITCQDDGYHVSAPAGSFAPNPWGLLDMHGNVAEWTNSPYGSELGAATDLRVVRGGSWSDRPKWATASVRWGYREHQKVYNVGFRVIVRDPR